MIDQERTIAGRHSKGSRRPHRPILLQSLVLLVVCAMLWPVAGGVGVPGVAKVEAAPAAAPAVSAPAVAALEAAPMEAQATTDTIFLRVISARDEPRAFDGAGVLKGDPVTSYQFMISVDNTGDPFDTTHCFAYTDPPTNTIRDPLYPDECDWPGVRTVPGFAPIYTQGNQDDLNESAGITLPPGKYLISVLGDGYKNDGEHFTIPMEAPGLITVEAHPLPLPPAQMVIEVFEDTTMANGQMDAPAEHGLAGFRVMLNDILGEITVDIFGNPLCSEYERDLNTGELILDAEGNAIAIPGTGGNCISQCYILSGGSRLGTVDPIDSAGRCPQVTGVTPAHPYPWVTAVPDGLPVQGQVVIPLIGTIRFDVLMVPPDGTNWIQTTTLEGSNGWDTWLQEAGTGLDNEFVVAAEPFPWTIFGFVQPTNTLPPADPSYGSISGVVMATSTYMPSINGLPHTGDIWGGLMGTKLEEPIAYPWVALNDLQNGDTAVWVGTGDANGYFEIPNVPPGNYFLSYWDLKQHYILDWVQVTVYPSQLTDLGILTLVGWFTEWTGHVFLDNNENGRRDPGEPGVPNYTVVLRDRDNTEIDRMSIAALTDVNGFYALEKGYPMMFWMVLEAYSDLYHTTGVTWQAGNQPEETTILGNGVDVGVFPVLSARGRLDWGVKPYQPGTNGGIAGTVFYDTVRAEDDAAYAGAEPWQPGIAGLTMNLWSTVACGTNPGTPCDNAGMYELAPDGSYAKGVLLNSTITEDYVRPKGCIPRDVNGDAIDFPSLPPYTDQYDCLEGPLMNVQFGKEWAQLPGNWGFGEIYTPSFGATGAISIPMPAGDYLVEVVVPNDPAFGRPLYTPTREEDPNIYDGDEFYPFLPPSACAGALHTVDILNSGTDNYPATTLPNGITVPASTPVDNPGYAEAGGSRFEGVAKPLCNVKLVTVADQKGIAPIFNLWTPVPIPGKWRGYVIDDLNLTTDPLNLTFGEKIGMNKVPVGIYDYTGRLVHTMHTDYHGVFEVMLPSDATYNAPTPSGQLASVYYIYGNDPGQPPNNFNPLYNPAYRSIGTSFEIYPGTIIPADLAPTQNGVGIWRPGSQQQYLASCALDDTSPQLFAVDAPFTTPGSTLTIRGLGFGATQGSGRVRLRTTALPIISWSDRQIVARVIPSIRPSAYQLEIQAANGQVTVNGLTIHVLGTGYNPPLFEVGPGKPYATIQSAIDTAAGPTGNGSGLVVVYPGAQIPFTNPLGLWLENPVIYSPIKLQGVGPGGTYPDGTIVYGSILDGRGMGGNEIYASWWRTNLGDIWLNRGGWDGSPVDLDGNPLVYEGSVITVLANDGEFPRTNPAIIDGFTIQGGDQQGLPNNLDQNGGGIIPGVPANVVIQGGGIYVHAYARYMQITNNVVRSNGGAYAGGIRIGTPHMTGQFTDAQNDDILISDNRVIANGGTNLAGGIGLFNGAQRYRIVNNDICGNFSAEYGGGISHYGYSPNGRIEFNRIYFNQSYDEGGGIMIAGELPNDPTVLSPGAGPVNVFGNQIQANLANDDGGGLRFLMSGFYPFDVYNNIIVNNISTHEGGGISINDAPDVDVYNNTILNNITTATSMTSDGLPAPAGLSTSRNSTLLQATLPAGYPLFSEPLVFNNLLGDNRAGWWTGGGVAGIGQQGDPNPINYWDLGVAGMAEVLAPSHSILWQSYPFGDNGTNIVTQNPGVVEQYEVGVRVYPWRGNPAFIGANIVAIELPPNMMGDYHITAGSPALNAGIGAYQGVSAPSSDFERQPRPINARYDIGADELALPFLAQAILYPRVAGAPPVYGGGLLYYLPLVVRGVASGEVDWAGAIDSFVLDPASGVTVRSSGTLAWYRNSFGTSQEVYLTFTGVAGDASHQDLLLKMDGLTPEGQIGPDTTLIDVGYDATLGELSVRTLSPGGVWNTIETFGGIQMATGDVFGARAFAGGVVELYLNGQIVDRVDLSAGDSPWAYYTDGGWIGVWYEGPGFQGRDAVGFTDFGGGSLD